MTRSNHCNSCRLAKRIWVRAPQFYSAKLDVTGGRGEGCYSRGHSNTIHNYLDSWLSWAHQLAQFCVLWYPRTRSSESLPHNLTPELNNNYPRTDWTIIGWLARRTDLLLVDMSSALNVDLNPPLSASSEMEGNCVREVVRGRTASRILIRFRQYKYWYHHNNLPEASTKYFLVKSLGDTYNL